MGEIMVIEGLDPSSIGGRRSGGSRRRGADGRFTPSSSRSISIMGNYDEIVPPDMGGLDLGFINDLWPSTTEVMSFGKAGAGVIGGVLAARWVENQLTSRGLPKFATPVVHGIIGIAAAKYVSRWDEAVGVGIAGAFGAFAVSRLIEIVTGRSYGISGFDGVGMDGFADLLGEDVLPAELGGMDIGVETRQLGAGMGGMGQVSVEQAAMAGWSW